MSEHTAGPWDYRSQPHDDWGTVRAGRYIICQARDPKVDHLDLSHYRKTKTDPFEANARLITAAPDFAEVAPHAADLLAQYADFVRTVKANDLERHPYLPSIDDTVRGLRDAIAKATATIPARNTSQIGEG